MRYALRSEAKCTFQGTSADGHLIMRDSCCRVDLVQGRDCPVSYACRSNIIGIIKRPASIEFSLDISAALTISARIASGFGVEDFQMSSSALLPKGTFVQTF